MSYCEREANGFARHPHWCQGQCSLCRHIEARGGRPVLVFEPAERVPGLWNGTLLQDEQVIESYNDVTNGQIESIAAQHPGAQVCLRGPGEAFASAVERFVRGLPPSSSA